MSKRKPISQREAIRLRKEVKELRELEARRNRTWIQEYPGGVNIWTFSIDEPARASIDTAMRLDHIIVAKLSGGYLKLYAVKP